MLYHLLRGGWDDPHCARPTRAFGGRALREHRDRPSYPAPFSASCYTIPCFNKSCKCTTPTIRLALSATTSVVMA